jgi:hypothetical protein
MNPGVLGNAGKLALLVLISPFLLCWYGYSVARDAVNRRIEAWFGDML